MHRRRAFTLVELLVVIALIGVLAALLLSALSSAQQRARATQTTSTMEAFAAACETFFQDHGQYPGVVPEALLAQDAEANNGIPRISSLENALYHMMGGYLLGVHPDYVPMQWILKCPLATASTIEVCDQFRIDRRWTQNWWTAISLLLHPTRRALWSRLLAKSVVKKTWLMWLMHGDNPWRCSDGNERSVCCPTIVLGMTAILQTWQFRTEGDCPLL